MWVTVGKVIESAVFLKKQYNVAGFTVCVGTTLHLHRYSASYLIALVKASVDLSRLLYEGHVESKERFAVKKYLLIIGKKKNMQVLSQTFTYFST